MQKAHKAVLAAQYLLSLHRHIVPSMAIRVHFATNPSSVYTKVALMQGAYFQEVMGIKSLKMENLSRCKRRTKLYRPDNISVPCIAL